MTKYILETNGIILAVTKKTYIEQTVLLDNLPVILQRLEPKRANGNYYWIIHGYSSFTDDIFRFITRIPYNQAALIYRTDKSILSRYGNTRKLSIFGSRTEAEIYKEKTSEI